MWLWVVGVGVATSLVWWLSTRLEQPPSPPKVVLITGTSAGLGQLLQAKLQHEFKEAKIIGTSRRGETPQKWSLAAGKPIRMDVTDDSSVNAAVAAIERQVGHVDVLINNAGIAFHSLAHTSTSEDVMKQFDVNFFGVLRMVKAVAEGMKQRKQGYIITIGSIGGRIGLPYFSLYSASKAAVANYTDALRMELLRYNVRVTTVEPGDFAPGQLNTFHSEDFKADVVATKAEEIMRLNEAKGPPPDKILKVVVDILRTTNPKVRYIVGNDANLVWCGERFFPRRLQQYLIMDEYKVPRS
eukprot:gb/GEZN01011963.1/.p1 GENE.gb/GEZN01011963.1/~~gb/GEZN01011963.1/.p1  ORF type:complete len:306 (+),score=51.13 gb/GEZN01011963.1/:27-920(+)